MTDQTETTSDAPTDTGGTSTGTGAGAEWSVTDNTVAQPDAAPRPIEVEAAPQPVVRTLQAARALPVLLTDEGEPLESDDPTVILAFKDEDGRTLRVVLHEGQLAATLVVHEAEGPQ